MTRKGHPMRRTLTLGREALTELSADELGDVVGGQLTLVTIPMSRCLSDVISCFYC